MNNHATIQQIFKMKTIVVIGFSPKPERPSHYVAMYLKENGYGDDGWVMREGGRCAHNMFERRSR